MPFNIEIYGDNAGAPDLTNQLATYTATIDGFETGEFFANYRRNYEIYF